MGHKGKNNGDPYAPHSEGSTFNSIAPISTPPLSLDWPWLTLEGDTASLMESESEISYDKCVHFLYKAIFLWIHLVFVCLPDNAFLFWPSHLVGMSSSTPWMVLQITADSFTEEDVVWNVIKYAKYNDFYISENFGCLLHHAESYLLRDTGLTTGLWRFKWSDVKTSIHFTWMYHVHTNHMFLLSWLTPLERQPHWKQTFDFLC